MRRLLIRSKNYANRNARGHHKVLLSILASIDARIEDIKINKPTNEQALRLKLIRNVPLDLLPPPVVKAGKAWDKADKALDNFTAACSAHKDELEVLHKQLCVADCPWDGKTIFSLL